VAVFGKNQKRDLKNFKRSQDRHQVYFKAGYDNFFFLQFYGAEQGFSGWVYW